MVLSGDGGDELFAGYRSYEGWMRWISWEGRPRWRKLLYPLMHYLRPHRYLLREASAAGWLRSIEKISESARRSLWRRELAPSPWRIPDAFRDVFRDVAGLDPLQAVQLADLQTYLPNDILTKVDVASMMNSLEVRTPLVDIRVAEFAARIPPELNFRRKASGGFEGKLLLKILSTVCSSLRQGLRVERRSCYPQVCAMPFEEAWRTRSGDLCYRGRTPLVALSARAFG